MASDSAWHSISAILTACQDLKQSLKPCKVTSIRDMLTNYLVYLNTQFKLPLANRLEQRIVKAAHVRRNKQGNFQWRDYQYIYRECRERKESREVTRKLIKLSDILTRVGSACFDQHMNSASLITENSYDHFLAMTVDLPKPITLESKTTFYST